MRRPSARKSECNGPTADWSPSYRVFANQFVVVDRAKPQAAYWYPGR
jgi:hypothetical protein